MASFNGQTSLAVYRSNLPDGLPSQRISFRMRTRSYYGVILEARAPSGQNQFIKVRVRGGTLEVNYLLRDSGFSSSLRMRDPPVNDGRWHDVEVVIDGNTMKLLLSRNGTITEEQQTDALPLGDTAASLASLVTGGGSLQVGEAADGREQPYGGCLEEVRVGGLLLPFLYDHQMVENAATKSFVATAFSAVGQGCPGPDVCARVGHQCGAGASCRDTWRAYECSCDAGYAGAFCRRDDGQCAAGAAGGAGGGGGSCQNGGLCLEALSDYTCLCPHGFTGTRSVPACRVKEG